MLNNPFVIGGKIPSEYFCDREKESKDLIKYIINHNNVVLISPRRMGKSGLINHCFDTSFRAEEYATIYIDILQTSSLKELVYILGKAIYMNIVPKTKRWTTKFFQTLKSLNGKFTFDNISGYPSFNIMLGEITFPELTLEEIFSFLENYEKRCVVAIDEFQQITKYPEKNIEAILRTHIQQTGNVNFIFSGSERHIMQEMFLSYNRPFYNSSTIMVLDAIPKSIYIDFAKAQFDKYGKKIERKAIEYLYDLFEGYTYYLQKTLNVAFSEQTADDICENKTIKEIILNILEANSTIYREILSNIPERQKELLYALAIEGKTERITSSDFIKKYNLISSSSVQSASKQLLEKDFITKLDRKYSLSDKFFSLWIKQIYGFTPFSL